MASRDNRGRFLRGHREGGRGSRTDSVVRAFAKAGLSTVEAKALLVQKTVEAAQAGSDHALARLDRWFMPQGRTTPGVLRGARTAVEQAEAVTAAVESGRLTAQEAAMLARGPLEFLAQAGEWEQARKLLNEMQAKALPSPTVSVVRVGPEPGPTVDVEFTPSSTDEDPDK